MNRSGIKRGLAITALSAMAITGIPAIAQADTIDTQVTTDRTANGVTLFNSDGIRLSTKTAGTDSTVRLEAGGGTNVARVTFQAARNGSAVFQDIATVTTRNDDGAFSVEFNPATLGFAPGDTAQLRVVNPDAPLGAINTTDTSAAGLVVDNGTVASTNAIDITNGTQKGYFIIPGTTTPLVGLTGVVSNPSVLAVDAPLVSWLDGDGTKLNQNAAEFTAPGRFAGILNLTGYTFDNPLLPPAEADQLVTQAQTDNTSGGQTEDLEAYTLYAQTITTVTASLTSRIAPDPAQVTITVLDQNRQPVAGATVTEGRTNTVVGTTRGDGTLVVAQPSGSTFYYANADANNTQFSPTNGDVRSGDVDNRDASVSLSRTPSGARLPLGTTVRETITVRDANGAVVANRSVRITRRSPGSTERVFRTTNNAGVVTYSFTGTREGTTTIEAAISVPDDTAPFEDIVAVATDRVTFGNATPGGGGNGRAPIRINTTGGQANGGRTDLVRIRVTGPNSAAGAKATLFRKVGNRITRLSTKTVNGSGRAAFAARDLNGRRLTSYFVKVAKTNDTQGRQGPVKKFR